MRGSRDGGVFGPIYRREGVEAKLKGAWGRLNWLGRARRRGVDRRRWRGAWWAACRRAKGPGMRVGARRGQADIQVSSVAFLGLDGRGNAVDKVHGGVRARFENLEREMEVGTYLQFLNSQGPLDKIKFSLSSGAQMKKC